MDEIRWFNYFIGWLSGNPDLRQEVQTGDVHLFDRKGRSVGSWNMKTGAHNE